MSPDRVRGRVGACPVYPALLVIGMLLAVPQPGQAQADSVAVRAIRADLAMLEKAAVLCEAQAAELARLLTFTASLPHQVDADALKTFRQQLNNLTACLTPLQHKLPGIQKAMPPLRAQPRPDTSATYLPLQKSLATLQGRMKTLGTQIESVKGQLDRLSEGILPPDSTQHQPRPGW